MKTTLSILLAIFLSSGMMAQSDNGNYTKDLFLPGGYFNLNYTLGLPSGAFGDFITDNSYRGFMGEGHAMVNPNWAFGGGMGWTGFESKFPRATYYFEQGALTGVVKHTYYNFSIFGNVYYYPLAEASIKPYVGASIGPVYQTVQIQAGRWYVEDQNWQMMAAPELGIFIPFGEGAQMGINTAVRYNYITYSNSRYQLPNGISYFQWIVGLGFQF